MSSIQINDRHIRFTLIMILVAASGPITAATNDSLLPQSWLLMAEQSHSLITQRLQQTSHWLDSFFGDAREDETLASSSLRLRITSTQIELESNDTKIQLRGKVVLPRMNRRLQLVFEGEPEGGDVTGLESDDGSSALRFLIKDSLLRQISVSSGFRGGLSNPRLFMRARLRITKPRAGRRLHRITPTLTYDTSAHFEAYIRYDIEKVIDSSLFFRSKTRPVWRQEKPGFDLEQDFTVIKQLSDKRYIALDWLNTMTTQPAQIVKISRLRIRHRRSIWRDRLFVEISPGMRFTSDHSHRLQWEGQIKLELLFTPN